MTVSVGVPNRGRGRCPDAPHGTLRGYQIGCRCLWCTSAKTAATEPLSTIASGERGAR